MALIKESYGLVYNTDGTLCTTYRDDDIPFPGVRSFAVEEATENLITDLDPRNWNNFNTIVELTDDKYMGMPVYKVTMPETTNPRIFVNIPYTNGMTLTGSVYIKGIQYSSVSRPFLLFRETGFGTVYKSILFSPNIGQWERMNINHTFVGDGTVMFMLYVSTTTNDIPNIFYMAMPQVEEKAFTTSFVDGSRPSGKIVFEDMHELEHDNFVFTCWANYRNISGSVQNVVTIFEPMPDGGNHYRIHKDASNNFYVYVKSADLGTEYIGIVTIDEGWHFFLIAVHDGYTEFWIDDTKYMGTKWVGTSVNKNIYVGSYATGTLKWNNTIANIFTGKYKKPNGTVIWTDDYIREVYEAKIPFPVQSQLAIY